MKPYLFLLLGFIFFIQKSEVSNAQDCDGYYPVNPGAIMESTYYNEKGKLQSMTVLEIKSKENAGNKVIYNIHMISKDEKGKEVLRSDFEAACENGIFSIGMQNMISSEQRKAWEGMEAKITADAVEIPSEPIPGQALKDAHLTVELSMSGLKMPGTSINITNRKVESMEKITTPVGTFDCIKISYDLKMKSVISVEMHVIEWFSKGNGLIRSESFKGEKLKGYSELTKLTK